MNFATVYKPNSDKGVSFDAPSCTQRQFKDDCDINNMIRRALCGDMSVFSHPKYMDVLNAPESFHDAASKTAFAQSVWEELPEEVRASYGSAEALVMDFDRQVERLRLKNDEMKNATKVVRSDESAVKPAATSTVAPVPSTT